MRLELEMHESLLLVTGDMYINQIEDNGSFWFLQKPS